MTLDYGITDCDTHCYEPRDAFTRYLPKDYLDRAITPVRDAAGMERILAGGRIDGHPVGVFSVALRRADVVGVAIPPDRALAQQPVRRKPRTTEHQRRPH